MGFLGIMRVNFESIRMQRELEAALEARDLEVAKRIISESIVKILDAGLTKNEQEILAKLKLRDPSSLGRDLREAFDRGLSRDGNFSLSNGMDAALRRATELINASRES